jgi:hypothetical protein
MRKKTRRVSGALCSLTKINVPVGARLAGEGDFKDAFVGKPAPARGRAAV